MVPGDVLEVGGWCHAEGIYFSDTDDMYEPERGHFDYPCEGYPQDHVPVAIVELPKEVKFK